MPEAAFTILCIDDEVAILKALNRQFRRAGYRVLRLRWQAGRGGPYSQLYIAWRSAL